MSLLPAVVQCLIDLLSFPVRAVRRERWQYQRIIHSAARWAVQKHDRSAFWYRHLFETEIVILTAVDGVSRAALGSAGRVSA